MSEPFKPLPTILTGEYQHYKGGRYRVIGVAHHSETLEPLVVYQALYGDHSFWARPAMMFTETVTINGVTKPRFRRIAD